MDGGPELLGIFGADAAHGAVVEVEVEVGRGAPEAVSEPPLLGLDCELDVVDVVEVVGVALHGDDAGRDVDVLVVVEDAVEGEGRAARLPQVEHRIQVLLVVLADVVARRSPLAARIRINRIIRTNARAVGVARGTRCGRGAR